KPKICCICTKEVEYEKLEQQSVLENTEIKEVCNQMKIKKLALATGEVFENIELKEFENKGECLPPNMVKVIDGKQELLINKEFILSLEVKRKTTF
ncbi:TPA: hypothetical protein P1J69_003797, partial [Clostridioides difficile]|nr:hypothetical protein [Clostridioides difficile]